MVCPRPLNVTIVELKVSSRVFFGIPDKNEQRESQANLLLILAILAETFVAILWENKCYHSFTSYIT